MSENINRYFKDIRKSKPLTLEEEVELGKRIQDGDQEALNTLVSANLRFVISEARKYQGRGMELNDLISEGNVGLIQAAYRFDPNAGFKFITYAVWWIKQAITYALSNNKMIRLPMNQVGCVNQINKAKDDFLRTSGRLPSDVELSKMTGIPVYEIKVMREATRAAVSVDSPIREDGEDTLECIIENPEQEDANASVMRESLTTSILRALQTCLSKKECTIVQLSFGIDVVEQPDEKIGKTLDISGERVRQLRAKAILKLKHNSKVLGMLREYLG